MHYRIPKHTNKISITCQQSPSKANISNLEVNRDVLIFLFFISQVSSEMVRQLSATSFILMDALCRNDGLSRSLWNLHRALFASDVGQGGKGIGR